MQTTLRRIDVGSAFRIGMIVTGLLFAVFGLLFVGLQGLFLSGIASLTEGTASGADLSAFFGAGVLSLLCFYGVGVVVAAVFGGIQFAVGAFCYNLAAGWVGGLKIVLETGESGFLDDIEHDLSKRKRDDF